jgi:hypothetical protein
MLASTFFVSLSITLIFALATSGFYYLKFHKKDISVAIVIYSLLIFTIIDSIKFDANSIGLGIGLLGILSLIRLRSTPENLIDIAFIFYSITIGLLNASIDNHLAQITVNLILTAVLMIISSEYFFRRDLVTTKIVFDEIIVKKLNDPQVLKAEIQKRFKIEPLEIKIVNINYLKDSLTLEIKYNNGTSNQQS